MPTYTYKCKNCRFQFEEFQRIVDVPLKSCPSCGGELERLITGGAGIIFKGSGFYITDYKDKRPPETSSPKKESSGTDSPKKSEPAKSNE